MTRFAILCPPYAGHLNPTLALARALAARGHDATVVAQAEVEPNVVGEGLDFRPVGASTHPRGTLLRMTGRLGGTTGILGIGGVIRDMARTTEMLCREAPAVIEGIGAEAVIADQTEAAGGLVARRLGLPHISLANALLLNREPMVPPPFVGWPYDPTEWGVKRNRGGYRVADLMMRPVNAVIRRFAEAWRLGALGSVEDCLSSRLQISQTVEDFDFPREQPPLGLVHVGPLRDAEAPAQASPEARGLVFCSLGTLQGARFEVFEAVARACQALRLPLVIAHGGKLDAKEVARLPGRPVVEAFVPQRSVIARAAVVVTHGGLNTVLDALAAGVPPIVVPIAFEQGAIAARVARSGAGLVVPLRRLSARRIEDALRQVVEAGAYRERAGALQRDMARAGGVGRAVRLIEAMIADARPPP